MNALIFSVFDGPEVVQYIPIPDPALQMGELLVQTKTIDLNYADGYRRKGNYHLKNEPPFIAGYEGADVVINADNIDERKVGDRICFADVFFVNSDLVAVPFANAIPLPTEVFLKPQQLFCFWG